MILAVFDVDHTLIRGDSFLCFAWYLLKRGGLKLSHVPAVPALLYSGWSYLRGCCGAGELKAAVLRMLLDGTTREQASKEAEHFIRHWLLRRIRRDGLKRFQWHRERNHRTILLSASPDVYLEPLARQLGADCLICTRTACADGYFTGEILGENCKGDEKVRRLTSCENLQNADFQQSYGYGNAAEDIPFLRAVGNPTAVNPDRILKSVAREQGWQIERWR